MEWRAGPNGPASPKKKSSFRTKMGTNVENIREGFKNAKDISARNLMDKVGDDESCSSESIIEEVVDLEEEETSEPADEVEYIEEIVDDSETDDSVLEPLPPPIEIPDELKVKEEKVESSESESSEDEGPPLSTAVRPGNLRGMSFADQELFAKEQQEKKRTPTLDMAIEEDSQNEEGSEAGKEECLSPKSAPNASMCSSSPTPEDRSGLEWEKPGWAKGVNLRNTGKSPCGNLARPITSLPHTKKGAAEVTSPTAAFNKLTVNMSSPDSKSSTTSGAPKSAPTFSKAKVEPPVAGARDDDTLGKIEWTKPDWVRKKVLRDTSKGPRVMAGQDLSRPIGGIRPVGDKN